MTYSEKLRDPKWIERRNEIKRRDNYTCRACGQNRGRLDVHHPEYLDGREPWEYADSLLITLCARCHKLKHAKPEAEGAAKLIMALPENQRMPAVTRLEVWRQNHPEESSDACLNFLKSLVQELSRA